jgi:hypothetical protein
MPSRHDHPRNLDEEGIPDLEGPLPGKEATGENRLVLVDDAGGGIDDEKDLVAGASNDEPSVSGEEAAIHVVDEPPGAVDGPDSYLEP